MSLRCVPLIQYCKLVETTPDASNKKIQHGMWMMGVQVLSPPGEREQWVDLDEENCEWAAEWNERVGITGERTQVQEIAAWLARLDNGADSALILAFEREHAELLSLVKDLKACLLSMTPTEFTDAEFCIATLDKTNQIILKHSGA